jgi:hypothetical protein
MWDWCLACCSGELEGFSKMNRECAVLVSVRHVFLIFMVIKISPNNFLLLKGSNF